MEVETTYQTIWRYILEDYTCAYSCKAALDRIGAADICLFPYTEHVLYISYG